MDELQKLVAERECTQLIIRYTHLIDLGNASRVADLFAQDAVWESDNRRWVGLEAIRTGFRKRENLQKRKSRHICTNISVEFIGDREARAVTYFMLFRNDQDFRGRVAPLNGPFLVGEYHDHFQLTKDGWRFVHRQAKTAFQNRAARLSRAKGALLKDRTVRRQGALSTRP